MLTQEQIVKNKDRTTMPPTKIGVFLQEFPWIKGHLYGNERIARVFVSRMETYLLNYVPEVSDTTLFGSPIYERLVLLDKNGKKVTAEIKRRKKKFFIFGTRYKKIPGIVTWPWSVEHTIKRLGEKADAICYILSYYKYTVILYKLPKNSTSIRQWIKSETEKERTELRKAVEAI